MQIHGSLIEYHIHSVLVSHKKVSKLISIRQHKTKKGDRQYENLCLSVRGTLHKETILGQRTSPEDQLEAYHIKKSLTQIKTKKQVLKIVDPQIRSLVLEAIDASGGFNGESVPPRVFFSKGTLL